MKKWGCAALSVFFSAVLVIGSLFSVRQDLHADQSLFPKANSDIRAKMHGNARIAVKENGFVRVTPTSDGIYCEEYDSDFKIQSKRLIPVELSEYGGFFSGRDAYFFVFGQNNTEEDYDTEVIRIVKYDKDWNRIGASVIKGENKFAHEIRYPFDYGNVEMTEFGNDLYLVTGHEGYVDPQYNQGHQGFLMIKVDEETMTGSIFDADLWHSFSQHIVSDASNIYVLEESEGSERTQITRYSGSESSITTIQVLAYGGSRTSAWAVPTYASADTIEVSDTHVLAAGSSIDQTRYEDEDYTKTYNVYLTSTPIEDFSTDSSTLQWVTSVNSSREFRFVYLTKISNDRFLLSWQNNDESEEIADYSDPLSSYVIHYLFLDGTGKIVSKEYKANASLSQCKPVLFDGNVVLCASDGSCVSFYTIDGTTGAFSRHVDRLAGDSARWNFKDGVITITGSGAIYDNFAENGIALMKDKVTGVVVGEGITTLGEKAFSGLSSLTNVELPDSLKTIGKSCFSGCSALTEIIIPKGVTEIQSSAFYGIRGLSKIRIPSSVKSIPEDVFRTGWYWVGSGDPVLSPVTVYCDTGSFADEYANTMGLSVKHPSITIAPLTTAYTGEPVEIGEATLELFTGKVRYEYFVDSSCKTKTTPGNSEALAVGGAPVLAGTYYVRATGYGDPYYNDVVSEVVSLTITPVEFTIRYNANGGNLTPSEQIKCLGKAITLSSVVPSRPGYKFEGWAEEKSAARALYAPGDTFSKDQDTVLYAVWSKVATPTPSSTPTPKPTATPIPGSPTATPVPGSPTVTTIPGAPTPTTMPGQPTPAPWPGSSTATPVPGVPTVTTAPGVSTPTTAPGQPTPTPYGVKEPSIEDFVERLYTIALFRPSEKAGKGFWVNEIESGNRTGGDCAHFFLIEAPEFLNRGLNDADFVETLYRTFFDRLSEPAGKSFWVGELKSKRMSRQDVIAGFIDSKEWCNVCATYGVRSGAPTAKAEFASKNAIAFATRLYTCCLDREPEHGGLNYWSLALTNLEQTGCSAAKFFFTGDEFVGFGLKNDEYVRRLYTTFMGRDPEASEIAYWVGEIAKGTQTKASVLQFFGSSEEFTNICKKYGIDRGVI